MVRGRRASERLGRFLTASGAGFAFAMIVFPLLLVFWLSFFSNEILSFPAEAYSLRWYGAMLKQPQFLAGFWLSFKVALMATVFGLALTIPASLAIAALEFRGREAIIQLLMAPLIVPAIVIGSALYVSGVETEIATGLPVNGSTTGFVLGHVLLTIPWCMRLILASLAGLDRTLEEAALSLGATPFTATTKVTLPLIWPGAVAAALFSFVVSFGNVELSLFLAAPGDTTLPVAILQYLQWKIDPTVAAVSVLQVLIVGAALVATSRFVSLSRVM
jgi:putative spermidine/putrescine transport system permease protein